MLIPLIPKDPERNDFTCRDGEIEFIISGTDTSPGSSPVMPYGATVKMTAQHDYPVANIRIPLESGDKGKAELMLSGQISRVDPATAERLTLAIVQRAAETLLDLSTDLRRQGLFILPFRVFTMLQAPDGSLSFPSPQAVALPADFPPHPEITAAAVADDCLTLALRFPVRPHRLVVASPDGLPDGYTLRTFISYPLYIPDPKDMRGSLGSVRTAGGGSATGIRFAFLTASAIKASVAAPEKYYEMVGNERTGYRISSKAAQAPDYTCYAAAGGVAPFPRGSLLALGESAAADTDPLDWIADWVLVGCRSSEGSQDTEGGYLPISLPHKYWHSDGSDGSDVSGAEGWLAGLEGIDSDFVRREAESPGTRSVLLTRPMTFAADGVSRRRSAATGVRTLRVLGLRPGGPAHAVLYGSDDGVRWTPLRRFDPRVRSTLLAPPRLFWRLLLFASYFGVCALEVEISR